MQQKNNKSTYSKNKELLLVSTGKIIRRERNKVGKGINLFSFEYDIGNGLLSKLENGISDTKITTLWKLANAFGYSKCSDFIKLIENELPDNFNFYDE